MRTDPRAAEVRAIVKRVFAGFLRENECFGGPAARTAALECSGLPPLSTRLCAFDDVEAKELSCATSAVLKSVGKPAHSKKVDSLAAFPRLYQPRCDKDGAIDDAQEFSKEHSFRGTKDDDAEIDEKILIDRGRYVSRTYRAANLLAMWLIGVGIVQFYDHEGRMLGTINLFESLRPKRMAA